MQGDAERGRGREKGDSGTGRRGQNVRSIWTYQDHKDRP